MVGHTDPRGEIIRTEDGFLAVKVIDEVNAPESNNSKTDDNVASFEDMNKAELLVIASEQEVEVNKRAKKEEIIAALIEAGIEFEAPAPEDEPEE